MALPRELINEFVKMTKDDTPAKKETNTYGTVVRNGNTTYVKLDGADVLTPVVTTTNVEDGERVTVMIKNHTAVVTGNITSPSARTAEVESVSGDVSQVKADIANVKILMADKVSTEKLEAQVGRIEELESDNVTINERLTAAEADIKKLDVENLEAISADIEYLKSNEAFVNHLNAITAKINDVVAGKITTDEFYAALADITVLAAGTATFDKATVKHLVAQAMNLEYGVGEQVFIKNLAVEFAQMVSATIGDLCIKASDGNYYLLDVGADGSVTATKTNVSGSEIAAGETNAGKVILGTDITAANLNTSNLLATYALVNKIDAARIDVDQLTAREGFITSLFAQEIFTELLRTSKIVGDKTLTLIAGEASDAKSMASSAQSVADGASKTATDAKNAASNAQSTANSANAAASNAQTTANNAQASVNNLDRLSNIEVVEGTFAQAERREGEGIRIYSEIKPKQDLKYGEPWPGGAGKNLFDLSGSVPARTSSTKIDIIGETVRVYTTSNTAYASLIGPTITLKAGTTYAVSGNVIALGVKSSYMVLCVRRKSNNVVFGGSSVSIAGGVGFYQKSFTVAEDTEAYVSVIVTGESAESCDITLSNIQLELGSAATSYAPYANTPPIEGWTGLHGGHYGKNMFSGWVVGEGIDNSTGDFFVYATSARTDHIRVNPSSKLKISGLTGILYSYIAQYDRDKNFIGRTSASGKTSAELITPNNCYYIALRCYENANVSGTMADLLTDVQIEYDEFTPYEPYQGTNYMLDFGKNLLPNEAATQTVNGVTFTVNADDSIVINGTATAQIIYSVYRDELYLPAGEYIATNIHNGVNEKYYATFYTKPDSSARVDIYANDQPFMLEEGGCVYNFRIVVRSGAVLNNLAFYPMIRHASVTDPTYALYNPDMLEQTGGMVYGGKVDWHAGEMTVDRGEFVHDGTHGIYKFSSQNISGYTVFNMSWLTHQPLLGTDKEPSGILSNYFRPMTIRELVFDDITGSLGSGIAASKTSGGLYIRLPTSVASTPEDVVALFKQQPLHAIYKLAEPITIPLTPAIIKSLKGINTVYTDADDGRVEFGHELVDVIDNVMPPTSPKVGALWLDRSLTPAVLRRWSGTEWEIVNDVTLIESTQDALLTKQAALEAEQKRTAMYLKLDDSMKAVRIGQAGVTSEFRIDAFGSGVVVNDEIFSRFEANRIIFGNTEIRKPNVGGLAFDSIN